MRIGGLGVFLLGGGIPLGVWINGRLGTWTESATASDSAVSLMTVVARTDSGPPPIHTATGKIVSDHTVKVTTKVSGQIVDLLFEQGDRVKDGQVLARLEKTLPLARRNEASAALVKSKANLEYQRVNFDRVEKLYKSDNAPEIEFADARRALEEARAQADQSQAALDWAEKILHDCDVLAPISGVILERNVEVGDFVAAEGGIGANANAQFGTIADMTALRVEVDISELDISRLRKGGRCIITPDAYKSRTYDGFVMWIDPGANYSKATVQVKVRIEKPDEYLRVEGVAQVVFLAEDVSPDHVARGDVAGGESTRDSRAEVGGIWIPLSACRVAADGTSGRVFTADKGRLSETNVQLGRRVADQIEILSGLAPGQSIAADAIDKLTDGQRIKP